jgi:DNA transposition AAA+ family ATPase
MTGSTNSPTAMPTGSQEGRHLSGLTEVAAVETAPFTKAQLLLGRTVRLNDIIAISGPPGCGKTFAVDHFLRTHPVMSDRVWHWLEMPPQPTTKEVTQRLLRGLDVKFRRGDTEYELTEELVPHLTGSHAVVVIDEAQNLKSNGLQQLRYLHDRGEWTWTLVLVGSRVDQALSGAAELSSRVSSWVKFEPLSDTATLLKALRAWHPAVAALSPEVLLRVDELHARGNFRNWAQFLRALLNILDRQPPGTAASPAIVSAALAAVTRTT